MAKTTRTSTNRTFAENDPLFRKACELAGVPPTKRQASKWHRRCGRAYASRARASQVIEKENATL